VSLSDPAIVTANMNEALARARPIYGVLWQNDRDRPRPLRVGHTVVAIRVFKAPPSVRVYLGKAHHPELSEVSACLSHFLCADGVEARLTTCIRNHERCHDAELIQAIAVQIRNPFNARTLPGELVEEPLPDRVR
jgi:hypothetical protein